MRKTITRRQVLKAAGAAGAIAIASPSIIRFAHAASDQVVISSWGGTFQDALRKTFFEPFTKETGIKVVELTYGGQGLARLKAQMEAGRVEVDLLDGPPFWPAIGSGTGLLQKIDLSGIADPSAHIQGALGEFGYGYGATSWGITYSTKTFSKGEPRSWREFWDTERLRGRRAFFGPLVARHVEYALMADGTPAAQVNPLDEHKVDRAFAKLEQIKNQIAVWYQTTAQMEGLLINGEVDVGELPSTRAHSLASQGVPVQFEYNEAVMNLLVWVLAKDAPNKSNAELFLRFCSRADRQAEIARTNFQGPTNTKALESIREDTLLRQLSTYPDNLRKQAVLDSTWWAANLSKLTPRWNQLTSK